MINVGIDPGSQRLGVATFTAAKYASAIALDVRDLSAIEIAAKLEPYLAVDRVAIEEPGGWLGSQKHTKNLASMAKLYQTIGIVRLAAERCAGAVFVVTDSTVKKAITGHGNAKKWEVHRTLGQFLQYDLPQLGRATCADCRQNGLPDDHSPDAADAIAIAWWLANAPA